MGQLDATITFRCDRVRESRGEIIEVLFQKRVANGKHDQDEIMLCNLMRGRGLGLVLVIVLILVLLGRF